MYTNVFAIRITECNKLYQNDLETSDTRTHEIRKILTSDSYFLKEGRGGQTTIEGLVSNETVHDEAIIMNLIKPKEKKNLTLYVPMCSLRFCTVNSRMKLDENGRTIRA